MSTHGRRHDWPRRFEDRFSLSGGVDLLSLDVDIEEDFVGSIRDKHRGVNGLMGVRF